MAQVIVTFTRTSEKCHWRNQKSIFGKDFQKRKSFSRRHWVKNDEMFAVYALFARFTVCSRCCMQARWEITKSACEEKKRKYTAMTSQYQQWQESVHRLELRLVDVEKRLNQSCDPATAAVRTYFHVCFYLLTYLLWFAAFLHFVTCDLGLYLNLTLPEGKGKRRFV